MNKPAGENLAHRDWVVQDVWIVLEPFCAMQYISNGRHLPEDAELQVDGLR